MHKLYSIALLGLAVGAKAQFNYRVTDIQPTGYIDSFATALNGSAQVAGYANPMNADGEHAFLYSGGVLQDLGTLGGTYSEGDGIDLAGDVIGSSQTSGGRQHAFLYTNGTMHDLGTLGGPGSAAWGINSSAEITGFAETSAGSVHAYLYSNGNMQDLGTLGGTSSYGRAINDLGAVVGDSINSANVDDAFEYVDGFMEDLGTLGGFGSKAYGINSLGQIVGWSYTNGFSGQHAFLVASGFMQDLGTLGGGTSFAFGINSAGLIVGNSETANNAATHGFLFANGTMIDLNSVLDASGAGVVFSYATGINDNGYIAGYGTTPTSNGGMHALLLTPFDIDLPTSYSIFRGIYSAGTLSSLFTVDGNYLVVKAGPTLSTLEPQVSVIVNGTSSIAIPTDVRVSMTAHANTTGITQTIELWDFQASSWVSAASAPSTISDSTQVAIGSNPSRFVNPGTNAVKARVSWKQTGPTLLYQWTAKIDQVVWSVSP